MLSDDEILKLIEEKLSDACGNLWEVLTPEERREAFNRLIIEYLGANW